jgi:signal transduction histidine kinase
MGELLEEPLESLLLEEPAEPPEAVLVEGPAEPPEALLVDELAELPEPARFEEAVRPLPLGEPELEAARPLPLGEPELEAALADLTGGPALPPQAGPAELGGELGGPTRPGDLTRLAASVGHELRNPLTAVRTFAELLSERYDDRDFRERFASLVGESLTRVERVLDRLERLAELPAPRPVEVDAGRLLAEVLEERRARIRERRLVVLEELDRDEARARVDRDRLRFAFEALLDKAFDLVPERGDVYLAARQRTGATGAPAGARVLLRFRGGAGAAPAQRPEMTPAANALEFALADLVVRGLGGQLTLDTRDASETVVLVDLPA